MSSLSSPSFIPLFCVLLSFIVQAGTLGIEGWGAEEGMQMCLAEHYSLHPLSLTLSLTVSPSHLLSFWGGCTTMAQHGCTVRLAFFFSLSASSNQRTCRPCPFRRHFFSLFSSQSLSPHLETLACPPSTLYVMQLWEWEPWFNSSVLATMLFSLYCCGHIARAAFALILFLCVSFSIGVCCSVCFCSPKMQQDPQRN